MLVLVHYRCLLAASYAISFSGDLVAPLCLLVLTKV
jgi:hypothetical protein